MQVKDVVLQLLRKNLKGVQLFKKEDLPQIIQKFDLVPCNDIEMIDDKLVVSFDDQVCHVELVWEQLGPRNTLVGIEWKSN